MSHARPYDNPPQPADIIGTIKCARWNGAENATLIRMARKIAFEAEANNKEFQALHQIDLLLTCILDRVEADTEMLDRLETHLQNKTGGRNET